MTSPPTRPRRDPIFGAAVVKLTYMRRRDEQSPQFQNIYKQILKDLHLSDAEVNAYLAAHLTEVEEAIRSQAPDDEGDH